MSSRLPFCFLFLTLAYPIIQVCSALDPKIDLTQEKTAVEASKIPELIAINQPILGILTTNEFKNQQVSRSKELSKQLNQNGPNDESTSAKQSTIMNGNFGNSYSGYQYLDAINDKQDSLNVIHEPNNKLEADEPKHNDPIKNEENEQSKLMDENQDKMGDEVTTTPVVSLSNDYSSENESKKSLEQPSDANINRGNINIQRRFGLFKKNNHNYGSQQRFPMNPYMTDCDRCLAAVSLSQQGSDYNTESIDPNSQQNIGLPSGSQQLPFMPFNPPFKGKIFNKFHMLKMNSPLTGGDMFGGMYENMWPRIPARNRMPLYSSVRASSNNCIQPQLATLSSNENNPGIKTKPFPSQVTYTNSQY